MAWSLGLWSLAVGARVLGDIVILFLGGFFLVFGDGLTGWGVGGVGIVGVVAEVSTVVVDALLLELNDGEA